MKLGISAESISSRADHTNITLAAFVALLCVPFAFWILSRTKSAVYKFFGFKQAPSLNTDGASTEHQRNRRRYPYDTLVIDLILGQAIPLFWAIGVAFPAWIVESTSPCIATNF
jgi:hypothetical protein